MRGVTFQKPFELVVQIQGESWHQGDTIAGTLTVKNRGSEPAPIDDIGLALAQGGLRKVKLVSPKSAAAEIPDDAFKLVESAQLATSDMKLGPGGEKALDWSFTLDRNCPVTDSAKSLFVVYGPGKELAKLAHLELQIKPFAVIEFFVDTLKTAFRFVSKSMRAAKGPAVEVKLAPPAARAFSTVEALVMTFRMEGDRLDVKFSFQMKKVETAPGMPEAAKRKVETEQSFEKIQYTLSSGRLNSEAFEAGIRQALAQIESKLG